MIRVDGHVGIIQIHRQANPALTNVGERAQKGAAGQEAMFVELLVDPVEEAVQHWLGVLLPIIALGVSRQRLLANLYLHGVQRANVIQCQVGMSRFDIPAIKDLTTAVRPALGVSNPGHPGIVLIGTIAIGLQDSITRWRQAKCVLDVFGRSAGVVQEADFILFTIDRPEIGRFHLARAGAPCLDRGFVHGFNAGSAN